MGDNSQNDAAKQGAPGSSVRRPVGSGRWWLPATIALIAWACLRFPQAALNTILDPSWQAVLVYAREKGLQFGRDIVCTYGPLGFFSIESFTPHFAVSRIIFEILFGCGIAAGLCLVAWRIPLRWRIAMLAFFVLVSAPLHWGGDALYVDLGLFVWGFLCFLETGPRLTLFASVLAAVAAVGALIKITFLVSGVFTIVLIACHFILGRRYKLAIGLILGFALLFLTGWMLLGQDLSGLGSYLLNSYGVTSGYNDAMGWRIVSLTWVLIMSVAALVVIFVRISALPVGPGEWRWLRRGPLLVWLVGWLFVEWKYAGVRSDWDHAAMTVGLVPVTTMCLAALPASARRAVLWSRAATVVCIVAGLFFIGSQAGILFPVRCVKRTCRFLSESFTVILQPSRYLREKTDAFHVEQKNAQLPKIRAAVGNATADIFGQNQAFALFNELNYHPRPVFQSYAAYNRQMTVLNERFYLSTNSPEFVLFNLQAIDFRFAPLEDSRLLRHLLANYEPVLAEGDYLLLHRRKNEPVKMTLLHEGTVELGGQIDLAKYRNSSLWMEIDLQPSLVGRFSRFIYKPPETSLYVWSPAKNAPEVELRAPSSMLAAGFLASPMVLDNKDVLNLYHGTPALPPAAFAVGINTGSPILWRSPIHFRLYRIDTPFPPHPVNSQSKIGEAGPR